ncbi:ribonuclease III [Leptolyngbya sp. AN02str]|uniref:ribonuclease III n=1 Tax=Leptolyngbya sp. AN02str TaxID=3423363 RepID=UPI003D31C5AB
MMKGKSKLLNFRNQALLTQALTHRSFVNENPGEVDNERLEFLGDAVLTFLCGEYLYRRFPNMGEGDMTRWRSRLVDEQQLAKFAKALGLDARMRLGRGALRDGGNQNPNLLSSTFEAVVGARFLDCDRSVDTLRPLVEALFDTVPALSSLSQTSITTTNKDPKSQFQEWVQRHMGHILPSYITKRVSGVDHAPEYRARVYVKEEPYGEGRGSSKKEAEKAAARDALLRLRQAGRS